MLNFKLPDSILETSAPLQGTRLNLTISVELQGTRLGLTTSADLQGTRLDLTTKVELQGTKLDLTTSVELQGTRPPRKVIQKTLGSDSELVSQRQSTDQSMETTFKVLVVNNVTFCGEQYHERNALSDAFLF